MFYYYSTVESTFTVARHQSVPKNCSHCLEKAVVISPPYDLLDMGLGEAPFGCFNLTHEVVWGFFYYQDASLHE